MRKKQKQEILGILQTLSTAHEAVKDAADKGNVRRACDILAECQQAAVAVGTNIERSEGEGHEAVSCLEEYCETLYSIYEALESGGYSPNKTYKVLHKQLIKVENIVKNDVNVRKEAVFFPYKASMWDSLESVWRAADVDPDCDAYVVPIPYYDKNPDGSFGTMHYEIDQYPKDVPVTDYREYDLARRCPDEVFIHNPYDQYNLVTSVEPFYYAKNLKQYTEKLVYIPYFVLSEISPDNDAAIKGMEHFVTVPGVFYADQVIVQSEDMRKVYIKVLVETFGEETRDTWEKKILGLGSPKFDKLAAMHREDIDVPEEWKKIIFRPDGSRKKVVLYNISVSSLLNNDEKMLVMIKDVLGLFQEYQENVALLWRPHPLIRATIGSMRPQLWDGYKEIVDRYREEGWGIYDDTADLDRAIVLADAYYGSPSSVVQLVQKAKKPVVIHSLNCLGCNDQQLFLCSNICCFIGKYIVLISESTNAVVVLTKGNWKVEKICEFQNEKYEGDLYLAACCIDSKLIVIPYNANEFRGMNLFNGEQIVITQCLTNDEHNIKEKFITSVTCNHHLWAIGEKIKKIIGIDEDTLSIFADLEYSHIHGLEDVADEVVWGTQCIVRGNQILIASRNLGIILEVDNLTGQANVCVKCDINGFSCFYEYEESLVLIDNDGYEYLYHLNQKKVLATGRKFGGACWRCIIIGKKRYLFEAFSGRILCICENDITEIKYNSRQDLQGIGLKFQFVIQDDPYIYFQERFSGQIFILDTNMNHCTRQEIDISDYIKEYQNKTIEHYWKDNVGSYSENGFISLKSLLEYANK